MLEWKEKIMVPDVDTVHIADSCKNLCEECEEWGEQCESCDASVPLTADKWIEQEIICRLVCICGIPVGVPYSGV